MTNKNKKFIDKFEGPFRVMNRLNILVYDMQSITDNKIIRVHINRIKKFIHPNQFHENNDKITRKTPPTSHGTTKICM